MQEIDKAQRASELLNDNAAFNEALAVVRQGIIDDWKACKDPQARERCWLELQIVDNIKKAILAAVTHGKYARRDLDDVASGRASKQYGRV